MIVPCDKAFTLPALYIPGGAKKVIFVVIFLFNFGFLGFFCFCFDDAMFDLVHNVETLFEPRCEKTALRGFRPGPTQTRLHNLTRWLEA